MTYRNPHQSLTYGTTAYNLNYLFPLISQLKINNYKYPKGLIATKNVVYNYNNYNQNKSICWPMSQKIKKLLLIMELNETLLYIKNFRSKIKDFQSDSMNIKYDQQINNYGVLYRAGKTQLLETLFKLQRQSVDVAVWSNLDSNLTEVITQKYFGRHFRDLLFVLPTNRALYTTAQPQQSIKIPRELNPIYSRFQGYNATNTLFITSVENTLADHKKNDLLVPPFGPKHKGFETDIGCQAINKYLKGIVYRLKKESINDIRSFHSSKPLDFLYNRMAHRIFSESHYS